MTTVIDTLKFWVNSKNKVIATRLIICTVYLCGGFLLVTQGGFFVLTLIDAKIGGNPLLMIGLMEVRNLTNIYFRLTILMKH